MAWLLLAVITIASTSRGAKWPNPNVECRRAFGPRPNPSTSLWVNLWIKGKTGGKLAYEHCKRLTCLFFRQFVTI
jgi:hypothetical protein